MRKLAVILLITMCSCASITFYDNYTGYGDKYEMTVMEAVEERPTINYFRYKVLLETPDKHYVIFLVRNDPVDIGSVITFGYE